MKSILFPENVANTVQTYLLSNEGDEATQELIIAIGADLLDITTDEMLALTSTQPLP